MYKTNISMYIGTVVLFPTEYIMPLFEKENDLKEIRTIVLDFFSSYILDKKCREVRL